MKTVENLEKCEKIEIYSPPGSIHPPIKPNGRVRIFYDVPEKTNITINPSHR